MVTQKQIADRVGVSQRAVSAALRPEGVSGGNVKLNEQTRQRILEVAREMGYTVNRQAQILRTGKSGLLGIMHSGIASPIGGRMLAELVEGVRELGYRPLVVDALWFSEAGDSASHSVLDARVEGLVLMDVSITFPQSDLQLLRNAGIPMVSMAGIRKPGIVQFEPDRVKGGQDLANHMLERGCRRFAMILSEDYGQPEDHNPHSQGILKGVRKACAESGLSTDVRVIGVPLLRSARIDPYICGWKGMQQLIASGDLPDAVVCTNDAWAIGALRACREAGIEVPKQFALAGFNDDRQGEYAQVPLTSVGLALSELARRSLDVLSRMLDGETLEGHPLLTPIPGELVVRESTQWRAPVGPAV